MVEILDCIVFVLTFIVNNITYNSVVLSLAIKDLLRRTTVRGVAETITKVICTQLKVCSRKGPAHSCESAIFHQLHLIVVLACLKNSLITEYVFICEL